MADLTIRALWNGQSITRGIADTKTQLGGLEVAGRKALAALGIGFGIAEGYQQLRKVFHGVVEEATAFERLNATIARRGGASIATMSAMGREIDRLATVGSALEDTQIARVLEIIVETSGNAAGSVEKLGFALDLAAAKHIDYERAAKITGFIMKGEIELASRLAPEIKELARALDPDLKGSALAATKGFEAMSGVLGASADDRNTASGKITVFKRGISELSEALFKATSGGVAFLDFLQKVGDQADRIAKAIEAGSSKGGIIGGLLGGAVGSMAGRALEGSLPGVPRPNAFGNAGARQGIVGPLDPSWWMRDQGPEWIPPGSGTAGDAGGTGRFLLTAQERARDLSGHSIFRRGGVRGDGGTIPLPFADRLEDAFDPQSIIDKWKEKNEQLSAAIADPIAAGIAQGAIRGSIDFEQIIRQSVASLAQMVLQSGLRKIAFAALTGGFGGAAAGAPALSALGIPTPVDSMDIGLGGVGSSMARSRELRGGRVR